MMTADEATVAIVNSEVALRAALVHVLDAATVIQGSAKHINPQLISLNVESLADDIILTINEALNYDR